MKKIYFLTVSIAFSLIGFSQAPVIYLDIVTHNEDVTSWTNASGFYTTNRTKLITLTNYFQAKGVTWNMQSDYTYLNAVLAKDTGSVLANTNNKNILRWMYEDKGVEMDPHSHENVYIYPDVVKLMDSIGLPESKLVGGNLYGQSNGINNWTNLSNGQYGIIFPAKFWKPAYMMGGGTPMHVADIKYYGFWNPQSMTSYLTHDTTQHLVHMGVGCSIKIKDTTTAQETVDEVKALINQVQSGQYPSNGFYFQSIFFEQGDLNQTIFYNKVITVIDSLCAIVATGQAQWKTMKQTYMLWETNYNKQMFQWDCGQTTGVEEESLIGDAIKLYPNPNNGSFNLKIDAEIEDGKITVLNSLGQELYSQKTTRGINSIDAGRLSKVLHYCVLQQGRQIIATGKMIVE